LGPSRIARLILLALLLSTAGCNTSSWADLPVVSQFAAPTATRAALATATPTSLPVATPSPMSTASSPPATTAIPVPTPSSTTILPSPTVSSAATTTIPPAPEPTISAVEIGRGNPDRPWIALTFDAGSDIGPLPSILETLNEKGIRCTFFITGIMLNQPDGTDLLQRIVDEGHELGNHSDTHPQFTTLTSEGMAEELAAVEDAVVQLTGESTKPYFRPPFGNRDDRVRQVVQQNGYFTIYWTYEVRDWTEDRTAEDIFNRAVDQASNGAIVVLHVGAWETAEVLPDIIDELRARGYRLVTLSELLSP
jgi:peptidoglycan/xylan/chitin deacetylase (PgdA/CDA1 family)